MNLTTMNPCDIESLKDFVDELETYEFTPLKKGTYGYPAWRGEIHSAFLCLTDVKSMDVLIGPGWPFLPPRLFVQGIEAHHSTTDGLVCMWHDDDDDYQQWINLDRFYERIEEWCSRTKNGWRGDEGLQQDAYLNFRPKVDQVVTFNSKSLNVSPGLYGEAHGVIDKRTQRVDIMPGTGSRGSDHVKVLWFYAKKLNGPPPRSISEIRRHLTRNQGKGWDQETNSRKKRQRFITLFYWERDGELNVLPISTSAGGGKESEGGVMIPGPDDMQNLILRAGPNAPLLQKRKAVLFGAGALGGHVALLLAQSGVGALDVFDFDRLVPGNVARHISEHGDVGLPKAQSVKSIVKNHAPWTKIRAYQKSPMTPEEIRLGVADSDIVIDSTGNGALANKLGYLAQKEGGSLVSGALYRGGAVGRVRRYCASHGDHPILGRDGEDKYQRIPRGNEIEEFSRPATGCSDPVNNAPPASVSACASLIAQVAIDALTKCFAYEDEVTDVYFPLDVPPFNKLGRVALNDKSAD